MQGYIANGPWYYRCWRPKLFFSQEYTMKTLKSVVSIAAAVTLFGAIGVASAQTATTGADTPSTGANNVPPTTATGRKDAFDTGRTGNSGQMKNSTTTDSSPAPVSHRMHHERAARADRN
jgi:hypothetical protein